MGYSKYGGQSYSLLRQQSSTTYLAFCTVYPVLVANCKHIQRHNLLFEILSSYTMHISGFSR